MKNIFEEFFVGKTFPIDYDKYQLEITVEKMSYKHFVRCMFQRISKHEEAFNSIYRFFNEIQWFYDARPSNAAGSYSPGIQVSLFYNANCEAYLLGFKQQVFDKKQHQALGFFREAECNESPYYRFMCYRKILETPFSKQQLKNKLEPWIENKINNLDNKIILPFHEKKIATLKNKSLADWLYEDCRHPLSHATKDFEVIDPSNYDDREDIIWANSIMEKLAHKAITEILNVPPRKSRI